MTDEEREAIRRALEEQTRLHTASSAEARAFLLRSGVYTAKGELTPEYGGPSTKSADRGATPLGEPSDRLCPGLPRLRP